MMEIILDNKKYWIIKNIKAKSRGKKIKKKKKNLGNKIKEILESYRDID